MGNETAVKWLMKEMENSLPNAIVYHQYFFELFDHARLMEKQQLFHFYYKGQINSLEYFKGDIKQLSDVDDYYREKYGDFYE